MGGGFVGLAPKAAKQPPAPPSPGTDSFPSLDLGLGLPSLLREQRGLCSGTCSKEDATPGSTGCSAASPFFGGAGGGASSPFAGASSPFAARGPRAGNWRVLVRPLSGEPRAQVLDVARQHKAGEIPSGEEARCVFDDGEFARIRWRGLDGWLPLRDVTFLPSPGDDTSGVEASPLPSGWLSPSPGAGAPQPASFCNVTPSTGGGGSSGGEQQKYFAGDEVLVWSRTQGSWLKARVSSSSPDGSIAVVYHETQAHKSIPAEALSAFVRPLA